MAERKPGHSIQNAFVERWSPRAFTAEEISNEALMRGFEAARWSPSSGNSQPWRFLYARRGTDAFARYVDFLFDGNRGWARESAALVVVLARKDFEMAGKWQQSGSSSFDAGSGWMSFALQMHADTWATHGMAGIDKDKIRRELDVPENHSVEMMIAVGRRGDKEKLAEALRAREVPSDRKPLAELVSEGVLPATWR